VTHRQSKYLNNRAENSHQPTRQRERAMKRFKSVRNAQRFLSAFSVISAHFRPRRHLLSATRWRTEVAERFAVWGEVTALDAAAGNTNNPKLIHRYSSKTNCTTTHSN
jgi:putative transposase